MFTISTPTLIRIMATRKAKNPIRIYAMTDDPLYRCMQKFLHAAFWETSPFGCVHYLNKNIEPVCRTQVNPGLGTHFWEWTTLTV